MLRVLQLPSRVVVRKPLDEIVPAPWLAHSEHEGSAGGSRHHLWPEQPASQQPHSHFRDEQMERGRFTDGFRAAGFRVSKLGVPSARSRPFIPPIYDLSTNLKFRTEAFKGLLTIAHHFSQTKFSGSPNSGRCLRSPLGECGVSWNPPRARASSQLLPIRAPCEGRVLLLTTTDRKKLLFYRWGNAEA